MSRVQRDLAKEYNLTPKQVSTTVKQIGVISTIEDVKRLIAALEEAAKPRTATITYRQMGGPGRDNMGGIRVGSGFGALAGERADFVSGFGSWQSSVFGMGGDGPLSVDSILAFGDAEKRKAEQALADMAKLRMMGLSEALIKQFQAQGAQGMEVLNTLATGANAQQIAMLNAQNAATTSAYGGLAQEAAIGAGFGAGNYDPSSFGLPFGHGPKGGKGGRGAARGLSREDVKEAMRDALLEVQTAGRLELSADGMVATLRRERRRRGPLGLD
jgi:hypothetical protein